MDGCASTRSTPRSPPPLPSSAHILSPFHFSPPLFPQAWGWVQEMYGFAFALWIAGIHKVDLYLHMMAQPPWDTEMYMAPGKPFHIIHYTYGMDYKLTGELGRGGANGGAGCVGGVNRRRGTARNAVGTMLCVDRRVHARQGGHPSQAARGGSQPPLPFLPPLSTPLPVQHPDTLCASSCPAACQASLPNSLPPLPVLHTHAVCITKGEFMPGKYGEWRFDKRSYTNRPLPRHLGDPPAKMKNDLVRTLINAINEATAAIPCWDKYAVDGKLPKECNEEPGGFLALEAQLKAKGEAAGAKT